MRRRCAQAIVEFALVVPLFLGLTLVTFEAGRMMVLWSLLLEASREATRTAVLPATTSTTPVVNTALQLTAWFGVTAGDVTVLKGGVPVSGPFSKQRGNNVSVRISYTYVVLVARPLSATWPGMPFQTLPMQVHTQMRAEG